MSQKKHLHVLSELSAHPIARNIEWSDLIPALETIGFVHVESNGNYHFTRNDHTIALEQPRAKTVSMEDVLKIRRFLKTSATPKDVDPLLQRSVIVAIDHHKAIIIHNPQEQGQSIETIEADLSAGRKLHKIKHHAPFSDNNPTDDPLYFDLVIKAMMKSERIVILSHGTGSSNAAQKLMTIVTEEHPQIVHKIVAVAKVDLEAMSEAQIIARGTELLVGELPVLEESA
ncbi:MAG TPA: hypothetical protein VIM37_01045 [Candidatus Microsaccharimonas sp.]|jgi:hypothetical protein